MRLNKKINKLLKRVNIPFMVISFVLCVTAIVFKVLKIFPLVEDILFLVAAFFTGLPIIIRAIQGLFQKVIGIETLVTIAVIGAIVIHEYSEAAIVTFLFQFGSFLELKTLERTRREVKALSLLAPKVAHRVIDDTLEDVDIDDVLVDDILICKAGDVVAVDGVITSGEGHFNEASITGESKLVKKSVGDSLYSGSILDNGTIYMKATKVGEDTTFSKIINLVLESSDAKSKAERFIDKFAKIYTPFVIVMALLTFLIKWLITKELDIDTSITILVLACPGALVIGIPIANVAGIGTLAKKHVLVKGGDSLTVFSKTDMVVLDKTGTLTKGESKIINSYYFGFERNNDIALAKGMELWSNHPLSKAFSEFEDVDAKKLLNVMTVKGVGLKYQDYYLGGKRIIVPGYTIVTDEQKKVIEEIEANGSTVVFFTHNKNILFIFEIADELRDDSLDFIKMLKKNGIKNIAILTGDNEAVAKSVSNKLGISSYYANLMPEDKFEVLKKLKGDGHNITFVGDGINDSPALAFADTGISMGSGTDVAIETSDVVVIRSKLSDINEGLKIAKKTVRVSYENIAIAILTVVLLLVGLFLGFIHMGIGMFIHEASILLVILNAMRLLIRKDRK